MNTLQSGNTCFVAGSAVPSYSDGAESVWALGGPRLEGSEVGPTQKPAKPPDGRKCSEYKSCEGGLQFQ